MRNKAYNVMANIGEKRLRWRDGKSKWQQAESQFLEQQPGRDTQGWKVVETVITSCMFKQRSNMSQMPKGRGHQLQARDHTTCSSFSRLGCWSSVLLNRHNTKTDTHKHAHSTWLKDNLICITLYYICGFFGPPFCLWYLQFHSIHFTQRINHKYFGCSQTFYFSKV